jgi:GntR family transcriptional regulator
MPSDAPRYVQIFNTLSRRMETGKYSIDTRLPTESELCDEFNASRFTVREALRRLVEHGMVQRRQGAGSIVVSATPQARYAYSLSSLDDLFQFALDTHYELLSIEQVTVDAKTAGGVGAAPGERWRLLKGLRRDERGGEVFCYLHSYVAPRASTYVRELKSCVGPFYAHLAQRTGEEILDVEQDIYGTTANAEIASHLKCKSGTISTCALRRYVTKKGTLIASYNWHLAEGFHYRMTMSRTI